ncbi:hypothetical protein ACSS6W_000515 [Trichoderma asperelloides]
MKPGCHVTLPTFSLLEYTGLLLQVVAPYMPARQRAFVLTISKRRAANTATIKPKLRLAAMVAISTSSAVIEVSFRL